MRGMGFALPPAHESMWLARRTERARALTRTTLVKGSYEIRIHYGFARRSTDHGWLGTDGVRCERRY